MIQKSTHLTYIIHITQKKVQDKYQNLSDEEKEKKLLYNHEFNKNLSEEQKQKQIQYMRSYYLAHKKKVLSRFVDF